MAPHRRIGAWIVGVATAGALVGHACTYALVQPDGGARQSLLAATGHAWVHIANEAGAAIAIVAVTAAVLGRLARRRAADVAAVSVFGRLAALQVVSFVAMEIGERAWAGVPLGGAMANGVLVLGVVVQLMIALAAAAVLSHLLRSVDRLVHDFSALVPPPRAVGRISAAAGSRGPAPIRTTPSIRAPPSLVR